MNCSLNRFKNWSNEVMCPLGRLMNQSNVVFENVLMNSLQCIASVPPEIIIWVWKAVMWASESLTPLKAIFGTMKLDGTTVSMIAWEKGMERALTVMGGFGSSLAHSPMRCKSLRNSSLAWNSSSSFACDAAKSTWNHS